MNQLDRLENPDPEFFHREYVMKGKPAIITGVADKWKAMQWSPAYLRENFPGIQLRYELWKGKKELADPIEFQHAQTHLDTTVADFVDRLGSDEHASARIYCAEWPIFEAIPQLKGDVPNLDAWMGFPRGMPELLKKKLQINPFLWLGPEGVLSTLHFDRFHNFFVQLHGKKKWVHVAPESTEDLYFPHSEMRDTFFHFSPVDLEKPDLERFPRFAKAAPIETIVEPGEMVFTPASWWHHVRTLETSVSLNFFWSSPLENVVSLRHYLLAMGRRKALRALGLDGLRQKFEHPARARP